MAHPRRLAVISRGMAQWVEPGGFSGVLGLLEQYNKVRESKILERPPMLILQMRKQDWEDYNGLPKFIDYCLVESKYGISILKDPGKISAGLGQR